MSRKETELKMSTRISFIRSPTSTTSEPLRFTTSWNTSNKPMLFLTSTKRLYWLLLKDTNYSWKEKTPRNGWLLLRKFRRSMKRSRSKRILCQSYALMISLRRPKRKKETECLLKKVEIGRSSISNKFKKSINSIKGKSKKSTLKIGIKSNQLQESSSKCFSVWVSPASWTLRLITLKIARV